MAGVVIGVVGILVWAARLPGDIRFERGHVRIYIPVISMLLISIVASIVLTLLLYLFRR